jgi:hypothetical protein
MRTTGNKTMQEATIAQVFCHDAASAAVPSEGMNPEFVGQ